MAIKIAQVQNLQQMDALVAGPDDATPVRHRWAI
jgi:hypothetical protein